MPRSASGTLIELEVDREEVFAHDMEARGREEMVDVRHAPAMEFSIGIMPSSACPSCTAAKASSKVGHGSGSQSGCTC